MADVAATPINPQRHQDLTIAAANATPISTAKLNIMDAKMSVHTDHKFVIVIYLIIQIIYYMTAI